MHFTKTAVYTVVLLVIGLVAVTARPAPIYKDVDNTYGGTESADHGAYPSSYYGDVSANPYSNEVGGVSADPYQSIKYSDEEGQKKEINNAQYRRLVRRQAQDTRDNLLKYYIWDDGTFVYLCVYGPRGFYKSDMQKKNIVVNYVKPTTDEYWKINGEWVKQSYDGVPDKVMQDFYLAP
ncbi:hypothetical protein BDF19DRAFT_411818 [Syncephalis fuscata]|nr:hypothetical protein BDF19DRAFT_411818 [Syncephalis fuscata]